MSSDRVVLHLVSSFPRSESDHVAPFLVDLMEAQQHDGWDTHVLALHDEGLPTDHRVRGVPVHRVRYGPDRWEVLAYRGGGHAELASPFHLLLLPGLVLAMLVAAWRQTRLLRPDALVAHWMAPAGLVLALLPTSTRKVLTVHGNDLALASKLPWLARFVAGRMDAVSAISEALAEEVREVFGVDDVAVVRVPLPADLTPAPLPDGPRRLLAAGRASTEKGFDVLLDAMARPELADTNLTLVTDGPRFAELARRASAMDNVTVRAPVAREELFDLIRRHHVVVVPSRREGLGLFAVEAVALGRRVVASRVGGLPEAVADGQDGILVPPDDPVALAEALVRLPDTPPEGVAPARHSAAAVKASAASVYFEGER